MSTHEDTVQLLEDLGSIRVFNVLEYASRLRSAILTAPKMSNVAKYFTLSSEDKNYAQTNCSFGGVDCTDKINDLGVASAGVVLSNLADARGFHGLADGTKAAAERDLLMQRLMPYMYLDYVNRGLSGGKLKKDLQTLRKVTLDLCIANTCTP